MRRENLVITILLLMVVATGSISVATYGTGLFNFLYDFFVQNIFGWSTIFAAVFFTLILMPGDKAIYKIRHGYWVLIPILLSLNFAFVWHFNNDAALYFCHKAGTCPYSPIWDWINPWHWTQMPYKIYVFVIQTILMIPQFWLVKKGKLNRHIPVIYLIATLYFRLLSVNQEITPTVFLPLATINPAFILTFFVQKYFFGSFPPNFNDPRALCALKGECIPGYPGYSQWANPQNWSASIYHLLWFFWLIFPCYAWWQKRRNPNWDEDKFWRRCLYGYIAYVAVGFLVYYLFPFTVAGPWFVDPSWRNQWAI